MQQSLVFAHCFREVFIGAFVNAAKCKATPDPFVPWAKDLKSILVVVTICDIFPCQERRVDDSAGCRPRQEHVAEALVHVIAPDITAAAVVAALVFRVKDNACLISVPLAWQPEIREQRPVLFIVPAERVNGPCVHGYGMNEAVLFQKGGKISLPQPGSVKQDSVDAEVVRLFRAVQVDVMFKDDGKRQDAQIFIDLHIIQMADYIQHPLVQNASR